MVGPKTFARFDAGILHSKHSDTLDKKHIHLRDTPENPSVLPNSMTHLNYSIFCSSVSENRHHIHISLILKHQHAIQQSLKTVLTTNLSQFITIPWLVYLETWITQYSTSKVTIVTRSSVLCTVEVVCGESTHAVAPHIRRFCVHMVPLCKWKKHCLCIKAVHGHECERGKTDRQTDVSDIKKFRHHPYTMGYVCANFHISTIFGLR